MKKEELQVFSNDDFGEVRIIGIEGKTYFGATDSAKALGYKNTSDAISKHCKKDGVVKCEVIDSMGRTQTMGFITEGNLYRLIAKSKLPAAEKFESWVFDEVLPTIQKHGAYMTDNTLEKALTDPDFLIQLATQLKDEKQKRLAAEKKYTDAKPKIDFAEKVEFSKANITMKEFSDLLNIKNFGRNKMMEYLRNKGYLNKKNEPYRQYIEQGIFETKERPVILGDGKEIIQITTYITGKGQTYLNKKILEDIAS